MAVSSKYARLTDVELEMSEAIIGATFFRPETLTFDFYLIIELVLVLWHYEALKHETRKNR